MNKGSYFGIGIGVGLLLGAIAGILFAPHEGTKTRKLIVEKAKALKDKLPRRYKKIDRPEEAHKA